MIFNKNANGARLGMDNWDRPPDDADADEQDWPEPWNEQPAQPERAPRAKPLGLEWACDIKPDLNQAWAIKGLLPYTGVGLIYGNPQSGKSFLALDLAAHIALGEPWDGRKSERGCALYIAAEGATGMRNRIAGWKKHRSLDDLPLAMVAADLDLTQSSALREVRQYAAATREHYGMRLGVIVIDTLARTIGEADENSNAMSRYMANIEKLAAENDCLALIVHHRPKDQNSREPRGHTSIKASADCALLVDNERNPRKVAATKMKDGELPPPFMFSLESVPLGMDRDGDPRTTCIVELLKHGPSKREALIASEPKLAPDGSYLSVQQRLALRALKEAIEAEPIDLPAEAVPKGQIAIGGRGTTIDCWKRIAALREGESSDDELHDININQDDMLGPAGPAGVEAGISPERQGSGRGPAAGPAGERQGMSDAFRSRFNNWKRGLRDKGVIEVSGTYVWLRGQA